MIPISSTNHASSTEVAQTISSYVETYPIDKVFDLFTDVMDTNITDKRPRENDNSNEPPAKRFHASNDNAMLVSPFVLNTECSLEEQSILTADPLPQIPPPTPSLSSSSSSDSAQRTASAAVKSLPSTTQPINPVASFTRPISSAPDNASSSSSSANAFQKVVIHKDTEFLTDEGNQIAKNDKEKLIERAQELLALAEKNEEELNQAVKIRFLRNGKWQLLYNYSTPSLKHLKKYFKRFPTHILDTTFETLQAKNMLKNVIQKVVIHKDTEFLTDEGNQVAKNDKEHLIKRAQELLMLPKKNEEELDRIVEVRIFRGTEWLRLHDYENPSLRLLKKYFMEFPTRILNTTFETLQAKNMLKTKDKINTKKRSNGTINEKQFYEMIDDGTFETITAEEHQYHLDIPRLTSIGNKFALIQKVIIIREIDALTSLTKEVINLMSPDEPRKRISKSNLKKHFFDHPEDILVESYSTLKKFKHIHQISQSTSSSTSTDQVQLPQNSTLPVFSSSSMQRPIPTMASASTSSHSTFTQVAPQPSPSLNFGALIYPLPMMPLASIPLIMAPGPWAHLYPNQPPVLVNPMAPFTMHVPIYPPQAMPPSVVGAPVVNAALQTTTILTSSSISQISSSSEDQAHK